MSHPYLYGVKATLPPEQINEQEVVLATVDTDRNEDRSECPVVPSEEKRENYFNIVHETASSKDDSEEEVTVGKRVGGRRKINIEFIEDKNKRHVTFSKRKGGLIKKVKFFSSILTYCRRMSYRLLLVRKFC
jgi:hypothetical protein